MESGILHSAPGADAANGFENQWGGRRDSNPRPPEPQSGALPSRATPTVTYFTSLTKPFPAQQSSNNRTCVSYFTCSSQPACSRSRIQPSKRRYSLPTRSSRRPPNRAFSTHSSASCSIPTKGPLVQNGALSLTPQQAKDRLAPSFRAPVKVAYRWKQQHVTVHSPTTALLVSEGESVATAANQDPVTVPFVQTAVWVLRGGAWKILHAHQSSPPR